MRTIKRALATLVASAALTLGVTVAASAYETAPATWEPSYDFRLPDEPCPTGPFSPWTPSYSFVAM